MLDPDRYGFYQCGSFKTYRKWEAIEYHARTGIHPDWHFNDEIFGSIDWDQPPESSISDLYRSRAQQLRNSYDYLVLWYSGGSDSDTVLNSFVDNNIHVDEIVSWVNYEATGDRFNLCNGEIFNVAIPKVKDIQQKFPQTKHRILDTCKLLVEFFDNNKLQTDWFYGVNCIATANNASRNFVINSVPDWQDLAHQGKSIAFVTGTDKPRLRNHDDGSWTFHFIDMFDNSVTPAQQCDRNLIFTPEFFYWSPDAPLIVVKQAHIIKQYLKWASQSDPYLTSRSNGLANKKISGKTFWLTTTGIHRLIYPGWKPIPYQGKPSSPLLGARDQWFRNLNDQDRSYHNWRIGHEKRWSLTPDYWKNNPNDISRGYKQSLSRGYNLGT